jgi:hypothetical protein
MPDRKASGEDVWNSVIEGIIKFKDETMLKAVLAYYPAPGILFERHRLDVKNIFVSDPLFALKIASKTYNNNQDCLIYKLLPPSQQISYRDVRPSLTSTLEKLKKENKTVDLKLVNDFQIKADAYYKELQSNKAPTLNTANCQQVSASAIAKDKIKIKKTVN